MFRFPRLFRVRQFLSDTRVGDVTSTVLDQIEGLKLANKIQPGASVAITVGSRGIANIAEITKAIVDGLKAAKAEPFIVPAMGSHGGGTAEGQTKVLHGYGVTEEFCGCPIRASMETVEVCQAKEGFPVHFDKFAFEADHVFVAGRIKPHTDFSGSIESGLMKMMLIGLGKHNGAKVYHRAIKDFNFDQIVRSVGREVLTRCSIIGGLGIIENGYDETAHLEAIAPENFESREAELLVMAKELMPSLPFKLADVLIIDEIGKNISGAGMDTNIVGRKYNDHAAVEGEYPKIKRICVRGLTKETHGNATGLGMAEFCTKDVIASIDRHSTTINCVTSGHVTAGMDPLSFENDKEMLEAALVTIGLTEPPDAKLMWIRNTLDLVEVECSEAYWDQVGSMANIEVATEPRDMQFDENGKLVELDDDV